MPDPQTSEGFDAPSPEAAYAEAPALASEFVTVLQLVRGLGPDRPAHFPPPSVHERREILLREAAVLDRIAVQDGDGAITASARSAHEFARFDREHGTSAAGLGPGAIEWDPSCRPYVRREYLHWLTVPPGTLEHHRNEGS